LLVVSSWRLSSSECWIALLFPEALAFFRYWRQPRVPAFSVKHINTVTTKVLSIHTFNSGRLDSDSWALFYLCRGVLDLCLSLFCVTPYICSRMASSLLASLETNMCSRYLLAQFDDGRCTDTGVSVCLRTLPRVRYLMCCGPFFLERSFPPQNALFDGSSGSPLCTVDAYYAPEYSSRAGVIKAAAASLFRYDAGLRRANPLAMRKHRCPAGNSRSRQDAKLSRYSNDTANLTLIYNAANKICTQLCCEGGDGELPLSRLSFILDVLPRRA
jgi:hypothetical protein